MKTCTIGYLPELDYSGTEALNTICSNLLFAGQNMKKIVMTSCSAGDGKSTARRIKAAAVFQFSGCIF